MNTNMEFDFYDASTLKSYNLDKTIQYQLSLLDTLDVYTRKHCENVAKITCRLCEYLHCSKSFTVYCTICAYLHDLGKVFVPASILQKNGPLTDEEYEIMKKHTLNGYNMCMKDLALRPYAAGPLYHHEALNGTGYPNKLHTKQIPLEGQIIRVADEFDALVSKRQYKSHINISDALKIIIENCSPLDSKSKIAYERLGKNNPHIVKKLFKVVLEDINYEIYCVEGYVSSLQSNIKRLEHIKSFEEIYKKAKSEKQKNKYLDWMESMFNQGETVENYKNVLKDYENAFSYRKKILDDLKDECKKVKKLKV